MKTFLPLLILFISLGCSSCHEINHVITSGQKPSGNGTDQTSSDEPFETPVGLAQYESTSHPLRSSGKTFADIPYGNDPKNGYDLILPNTSSSSSLSPLVIFFHGGGFIQGNKNSLYKKPIVMKEMEGYLDAGIAVANVNYRLLENNETEGLMKCLRDAQHALQNIKAGSPENGIDPDRIVLRGTSAGASLSLWLALSDDMSQADSSNPILRESTRVAGAVVENTQSTLDITKWEDVLSAFNFRYNEGLDAEMKSRIYGLYGMPVQSGNIVRSTFEAGSQAYRSKVDFASFIDQNDPPIFVANKPNLSGPPSDKNTLFHHREHAHYLEEQAEKTGGPFLAKSKFYYLTDPTMKETTDFVKELVKN